VCASGACPRPTSTTSPTRTVTSSGSCVRWRTNGSSGGWSRPPRRSDVPSEGTDDRARVVVVGGGGAGTSIAYPLTKLGWNDVLVLDRSELTSGSTFHSAGLVAQLRNSVRHPRMMMDGVGVYPEAA